MRVIGGALLRRVPRLLKGRIRDGRLRDPLSRMALAALLLAPPVAAGPFDIPLFATERVPAATGHARLLYAQSPFGVALTVDGRAIYDFEITMTGLPTPDSLGSYTAFVAWAVTPDLSRWERLGPVTNGTTTVGQADFNKFLLVITAESDAATEAHAGPTVMHGTSPSGWLQSFLTHPLFRGITG